MTDLTSRVAGYGRHPRSPEYPLVQVAIGRLQPCREVRADGAGILRPMRQDKTRTVDLLAAKTGRSGGNTRSFLAFRLYIKLQARRVRHPQTVVRRLSASIVRIDCPY